MYVSEVQEKPWEECVCGTHSLSPTAQMLASSRGAASAVSSPSSSDLPLMSSPSDGESALKMMTLALDLPASVT